MSEIPNNVLFAIRVCFMFFEITPDLHGREFGVRVSENEMSAEAFIDYVYSEVEYYK